MKRTLPIVAGLLLVVAAGVAHGLRTERWGPAADLTAAAARLGRLPLRLGDWEGETVEIDPRQFATAGCSGYLVRRYVQARTGADLLLLVVSGRPGPIAMHAPEQCYKVRGYGLQGAIGWRDVELPDGSTAAFRVGDFRPPDRADMPPLRLFWSWSATGAWQTPDRPRLTYALAPVLYKVYVIRGLRADEPAGPDPAVPFLQALLPELNATLFGHGREAATPSAAVPVACVLSVP